MPDTDPLASEGLGPAPDFASEADRVRASLLAKLTDEPPEGAARIGRFVILERVGEGGMGVVYAAYDPELDRKVAVKLLRSDIDDAAVRRRVVREAQAMAKLSHPNVAQIFEVGAHGTATFIAMEFVRGQTLRVWHKHESRSWRETIDVYLQAAHGLAAAHAEGLVHRDFKPDNAIVGRDGRVRVLDFGLARADTAASAASTGGEEIRTVLPAPDDDALGTPLTRTGSIMGTPAYMAPEQFLGDATDHRTDQFSLCVALWEALYGERPFAGAKRIELIANVTRGKLREAPKSSGVPPWVRTILARGLSASPSERYADTTALIAALSADPSRRRRQTRLVVGGVLAVGVVIGGSAWWQAYAEAQRVAACDAEGETITAVWSEQSRAASRTGLLASDLGFAPSTWERVEARLDQYAAQWSQAREGACLAATVEFTVSTETAQRSDACLQEQRVALTTLVDSLAEATPADVVQALPAIIGLTPPAHCLDDNRLQATGSLPPEEQRGWVAEIRGTLARARALERLGRFTEALAFTEPLVDQAAAWPPLQGEVLRVMGTLADSAGDPRRAREFFERAIDVALRHGRDELALNLSSDLVHVSIASLGDVERAAWWGELGTSLAARLGIEEDERGALHRIALAELRIRQGEPEIAVAELERELRRAEVIYGPDHPTLNALLNSLSEANSVAGRESDAKKHLLRAQAMTARVFGDDHPQSIMIAANLGALLLSEGSLAEARAQLEAVVVKTERAFGKDHTQLVSTLYTLARAHRRLGSHPEALALYERARTISVNTVGPDNPVLPTIDIAIGNVFVDQGHPAEALARFEQATAMLEKIGASGEDIGSALLNVGNALRMMARHEEAVARYESALQLWTEYFPPEHPELAVLLHDMSYTYSDRELWAKVEELEARAWAITEKAFGPTDGRLGNVAAQRGFAALGLGKPAEAVDFLERAVAINTAREGSVPLEIAYQRFALARARWDAQGDRVRAIADAHAARDGYAAFGSEHLADRALIDEWLAAHSKTEP